MKKSIFECNICGQVIDIKSKQNCYLERDTSGSEPLMVEVFNPEIVDVHICKDCVDAILENRRD